MLIGAPLMTSSALQLEKNIRPKVVVNGNQHQAPTFVFKLELSDLPVFLLDPQNQTRTWTMSCDLVQRVDLLLVLSGDTQVGFLIRFFDQQHRPS